MSTRGRHSRRSNMSFYRDALLLVGGIVIVGALVFGGLSLWAGSNEGDGDGTVAAGEPEGSDGGGVAGDSTTTTTTTVADSSVPDTTEPTAPFTTQPPGSAPPASDTTVRQARDPSEVRVVVLNSIGVGGLAGGLSDELANLGYQMAQADNYTPELSDTMVFHTDGYSIEALDLSEAVGDGSVASDPDLASEWGVDIVVVIGRSYQE